MNKDLIKYALIGLGAYLVYQYIQAHGGLQAFLGTGAATGTGTGTTTTPVTTTPVTTPVVTTQPVNTIQPVATLDTTGLTVRPDVNNSLTGLVKINGQPTLLSIIQTDGRIFDTTGSEVTAGLIARGVDVNALRTAFAAAPGSQVGVAGLGAVRWGTPPWLM